MAATLKRLKVGQRVRLQDPTAVAVRFWDGTRSVGADGVSVEREALERTGAVTFVVARTRASRGLVAFGGSNRMWLDADVLSPAPRDQTDGERPREG